MLIKASWMHRRNIQKVKHMRLHVFLFSFCYFDCDALRKKEKEKGKNSADCCRHKQLLFHCQRTTQSRIYLFLYCL